MPDHDKVETKAVEKTNYIYNYIFLLDTENQARRE